MVFEVYIQNDGKFIVHAIPLHGFKAHFLRDHLTVLFIEHIILLGAHGTDNMHGRLEDFLHKGILTGCAQFAKELPCSPAWKSSR